MQRKFVSRVIAGLALLVAASSPLPAQPLAIPFSTGIQLKNEDMSAAALNKAQASGVKLVRKAIYWQNIETAPGVYNWSQPDTWIADMESRGFSMLITLVWNNRIYEDIYDRAIVTEPGRQAFANWAADVADRYAGKDIVFEIWNEPNLRSFWHENPENVSNTDAMAEEYTELVKDAAPAMKAADPNCRIAACSISALWTDSFNWFDRCIEMGVLTSGIDAISVHPYGFRWPELCYTGGYPVIRAKMNAAGATTMPIITSEVGYPESWLTERGIPVANVENAQAWMFVRQNLVDAMSGIEGTIWYELTDASYGMLETNLAERPTFLAAQVLTTQLNGYTFLAKFPMASGLDYGAIFENASGDRKLVVWTTPDMTLPANARVEVDHSVTLNVGIGGTYNVVDTFGNVTAITASGGNLTVTVGGGPRYIPLKTQEFFIDNNDAAAIKTGTWTASTADSGYYGTNYMHDGNTARGTKNVLFQGSALPAGDYKVYLRWTAAANRATNTPVTIIAPSGNTSVTVNQRLNGASWRDLGGNYRVGANGSLGVRVSNTGTNGYVIADAVRLVRHISAPYEKIVDNLDGAGVTITGAWTASTSTGGYYGSNYIGDGNTGKGSKSVLFQSTVPTAGSYQVYLRWTSAGNRAASVPVDITWSGGIDPVSVNQQANGGTWVLLGTYNATANSVISVLISNTGTSGHVIADAIRITSP